MDTYTGVLSIFSTRIRRGLTLPIFEDGLETRDLVHVDDVARAFVAALAAETPPGPVNVGSGVPTTVADVAGELSAAFGATPDLVVTGDYRVGDIRHNCADIGRLRESLGCPPAVSLSVGLRWFAAWVTKQLTLDDRLAELRQRKLMS